MPSRSRRPHFQSSVHPEDGYFEDEPQEMAERSRSQPRSPREEMRNVRLDMESHIDVPAVSQRAISKDLMQELPSRNRPVDNLYDKQRHNSLKRRSSRSSSYSTVRRLRNVPPSKFSDMGTDGVANFLEQDAQEVEEPEVHQREALRDLNYPLTWKRKVREKLEKNQKPKRTLGCWQYSKYTWSMKWQHFKTYMKDLRFSLQLWHRSMREIEGNLGSGVASYFYFLRWLLGLNILTSAIICFFVVLPQALSDLSDAELVTLSGAAAKIPEPKELSLGGWDFFTGGGWLQNKMIYYGAYKSVVFKLPGLAWYNIPLAYLLGFGMTMVVTLIFIAYSLAKSHKKHYIEQSGLTGNYFFNKVFCGWDFAITNKNAAQLQLTGLQRDLKEQLASQLQKNKEETFGEKCFTIFRYASFNLLSLAALGGIGYLVYYLLYNKNEWNQQSKDEHIREMFLSMIITAITLTMPAVFSRTVKYEGYKSRRTRLRVAMFRSMLLILVVIGCPLYFWIIPGHNTYSASLKVTTPAANFTTSIPLTTLYPEGSTAESKTDLTEDRCWETEVGKELYRFVIVDFLVCVLLYFPISWLRSSLYKRGIKIFGDLEFDVVWNTWNLLYNQTICWIGSFFSPLLPVVIIIKFIITFYIRKFSVMTCFQPPSRIWRAHRNRTDFRIVTFAIVVLSMLGVGYVIVRPTPSKVCGPFQGKKNSYEIVLLVMESFGEREWLGNVATYVMKPGSVTLLILALCCVAYYTRAVAKARFKMVQLLQEQVKLEGKDKVFLLRMYESALNSWHNAPEDGRGNAQLGSSARLPNGDYNGDPRRWSQVDLNRNEPGPEFGAKEPDRSQDARGPVPRINSHSSEHLQDRNMRGNGLSDSEVAVPRNNNPRENFELDDSARMSPYSPQFHKSSDNITSPGRRDFSPFGAGAINPVYRDDSPYKSRTPPLSKRSRDPIQPFPGITHQPPFQNLGMNRRFSKGVSAEDLRADSKKRPK